MLPNFTPIRPPDQPELVRAQDNISAAMARVVACPILDGVLIEDVVITTSVNVAHGLGRAWRGYLITKKNTNANVYSPTASNTSPAALLPLTASLGTGVANVTVSLWVF